MKYGVPVSGGMLSAHFGHCEQFALIDADDEKKEILKEELVDSPGHEPGVLPKWLADQGVNIVIAGGMGARAIDIFKSNDVGVVVGAAEQKPSSAVLSYLNGELDAGANLCDH